MALGVLFVVFAMAEIMVTILPPGTLLKNQPQKLELDGRIAIGQELNQLMRQGCHVFHYSSTDEA